MNSINQPDAGSNFSIEKHLSILGREQTTSTRKGGTGKESKLGLMNENGAPKPLSVNM